MSLPTAHELLLADFGNIRMLLIST